MQSVHDTNWTKLDNVHPEGLTRKLIRSGLQGMGLDFRAASGGPADPLTISTVASIIFDTR